MVIVIISSVQKVLVLIVTFLACFSRQLIFIASASDNHSPATQDAYDEEVEGDFNRNLCYNQEESWHSSSNMTDVAGPENPLQ